MALQADHYASPHDPVGWSVMVQGMTQEVTDPAWLTTVSMLPLGSWAPEGSYVALEPAVVTGRRIVL